MSTTISKNQEIDILEDDEFEEFEQNGWNEKDDNIEEGKQWEEDWDEDFEDDFAKQLRQELRDNQMIEE